jgi:DNA-binding transcriptional LysR family regulator
MEFRTLRAFVEVVRQGGFSQAAKVVFSTQSTVSKAVKQLEHEVGVPLLDRIGHRTRLTAAGEIVYQRALRMLAERDDLASELDELRGLKRGTLCLGLPPVGSSMVFAPLFAIYRQRYPGVDIRLFELGGERLQELLISGEVELAASLPPLTEGFEWEEVRREPMVALLSNDHELAGRATIRLEELKDTPFILFASGFALNRVIIDACRGRGIEPTVAARSSQIDFIFELAAAGLGVAFLPRFLAERRDHGRVAQAIVAEPDMEWRLTMVWRRGGFLSHAAKAWLSLVRETVSEA